MERHFLISETDRDGLVSYLQGRPYREVARGVAILMQLTEAPILPTAEAPKVGKSAPSSQDGGSPISS